MSISREQLMNFYDLVFDREQELQRERSDINESFKINADDMHVQVKTLKEGYKVYKSYKTGKATPDDAMYYDIVAAIEARFNRD